MKKRNLSSFFFFNGCDEKVIINIYFEKNTMKILSGNLYKLSGDRYLLKIVTNFQI